MKIILFLAAMVVAPLSHAAEKELLRCTRDSHALGAPVYAITEQGSPGNPSRFFLKLIPLNPTVRPVSLEIAPPIHYADTWIATKDVGRSGYAHLYAHGNTTLVDVNLFQVRYRGLNTRGPVQDYRCMPSR